MTATELVDGIFLNVVTAGTRVTDERSGETIVVTDECCAVKGRVMWLTQPVFDRMKLAAAPAKGSA